MSEKSYLPPDGVGVTSELLPVGWRAAQWQLAITERLGSLQPYLLGGWFIGLMSLSGRLLAGSLCVHRLRRGRRAIGQTLADRAAALAQKLGIGNSPGVFLSDTAREAALVTGLLRPIILLPAAWLLEMTPEVLEAVIRR